MFFEVNPGQAHENISNFKKYVLRLSKAYQGHTEDPGPYGGPYH